MRKEEIGASPPSRDLRSRPMWLITSGPTREHLDDVRFLSNASSGRMGFAIAEAARDRGHEVVLVQGPVQLAPPEGVEVLPVVSAEEMLAAGRSLLERAGGGADVVIGVAAVCDWRPALRMRGKPANDESRRSLELVPNPDVLATLAAMRAARVHVGFALQSFDALGSAGAEIEGSSEFRDAVARARDKIERKGLDAIVLNGSSSMESVRASRAWWLERAGGGGDKPAPAAREFGARDKPGIAREIVERCERALDVQRSR